MTNETKFTSSSKQQPSDRFAIVIAVLLFLLIGGVATISGLGYIYQWTWVGVVNTQMGEVKTFWDWMELWLIPFVLAIGAYLLNKSDKAHEQKIAEQQRANEREIAKDDQRQTALEVYLVILCDL